MIGDVMLFLGMLALAVILRLTVVEIARVKGSSMQPTLRTGQWLLVSRLDYRLGSPRRGDVVICHYPGRYMDRWKLIRQSFVKRVIGLPGERLEIRAGQVYINGGLLDESSYFAGRMLTSDGTWAIGERELFVMGDNRNGSKDSRADSVGPIPYDQVVGKVRAVIWPIGNRRWMERTVY